MCRNRFWWALKKVIFEPKKRPPPAQVRERGSANHGDRGRYGHEALIVRAWINVSLPGSGTKRIGRIPRMSSYRPPVGLAAQDQQVKSVDREGVPRRIVGDAVVSRPKRIGRHTHHDVGASGSVTYASSDHEVSFSPATPAFSRGQRHRWSGC